MWKVDGMLFLVSAVLSTICSAITTDHPEDLVQVLAGTDTQDGGSVSNGNTLPQIKMPWGFNDWAPQTDGSNGAWWFHRNDKQFEGMRCTHQPSPWIGDYGHILLQPHTGDEPADLVWSPEDAVIRPYLFNASLGEGIGFEFAPTSHAAVARVAFPDQTKVLHLSLSISGTGDISVDPNDGTVRGKTQNNAGGVPDDWTGMFFTLKPLTPTSKLGSSDDTDGGRATLHFENHGKPIVVALATSFISQEQADLNLEQEIGSKSFEDVMTEGKKTWSEHLKRASIDAIDETQLKVFYTNFWKSMLFPRYLQEIDKDGKEVHRSPYTGEVTPGKLVADSGFWDSYRTVYQLQSVVSPDNLGALIDGWVDAYKEASWLPQWASPGQHASMVGTMGDVVMADAIVKNKWGLLQGFDVDKAYEAIQKDAFSSPEGLFGRAGLTDYMEKGFVAADVSESVSRTLNYYVSDAAIAHAAGALGKSKDEEVLRARSRRYGTMFNNQSHFFQPKDSNGNFLDDFEPLSWGNGFTEAGAWQYRFYVPHDVEGLQKLYNGQLCHSIKSMMTATSGAAYDVGSYGSDIHEMRELAAIHDQFGLYAHGNQPVHHVLYVAKKAGCNHVADKYLRKVMKELYTTNGWAGDEDNGEMAAWYVLSALGIYQLEGAKDEIVLGSPAVINGRIKLPNNKELIITAENQADDHVYVESASWTPAGGSSRTVEKNVMKFTELMAGGELFFKMSRTPPKLSLLHLRHGTRRLRAARRH